MVSVKLKGVHAVKSKGRTYYYAWRGGPRIDGEPGTPEFFASYEVHKAPVGSSDNRKLGHWITLYKQKQFPKLAPRTQEEWSPWLDRIREKFGSVPVYFFDRPKIRLVITNWLDEWDAKPRTADMGKQVISRVLKFGVDAGELRLNPCVGMPNRYRGDRSEIIWTADDLDKLYAAASREIIWAAKLAAFTGIRQSDLLKLSWDHVKANAIEFHTSKGKRHNRVALVPLTSAAKLLLEEIRGAHKANTVLANSSGKSWQSGFNASWSAAMRKAWPDGWTLHFHDLRGTAATNFFRAGFTYREIAETMGWSEKRVERLIDHYVKRDEIMIDRVRRLERPGGTEDERSET